MSEERDQTYQRSEDETLHDAHMPSVGEPRASYQISASNSPVFRTMKGALPGGRKLAHSLTVTIEYDEDEVVVSESRYHMHASAPTELEALDAFRRVLSGYLDSLTRREKTLGAPLRDQLNYLRTVVVSE